MEQEEEGPSADVGHGNQVGKDACSRYGSTGTIALDAHRIFPVACCGEKDDVVAAFEMIEGVGTIYLF